MALLRDVDTDPRKLHLPDFALVVLIGASGCGKSQFAARHFSPSEIVSSDHCRLMACGDAADQSASADAFELLHFVAELRLKNRRLTVIDATNVEWQHRDALIAIARRTHAPAVAIVLDPGEDICIKQSEKRTERRVPADVVREQMRALQQGFSRLQQRGFQQIYHFKSVIKAGQVSVTRTPLVEDKRDDLGPFDIIGDVHGCCDELELLLQKLGYDVAFFGQGENRRCAVTPPAGRRALFVGDLVDRGPRSPDVLRLVMQMLEDKNGLCVMGNHEFKLRRYLGGAQIKIGHGLAETLNQLEAEPESFRQRAKNFLNDLCSHYWLDGGRLVVAHAGLKEEMQGRSLGKVRSFAMFGETTGARDEYGLPVRLNWAEDYRGFASVVYGHTPMLAAQWQNNTICIDTGCVFGGNLTALRWPERELVSVPATRVYSEPIKPLGASVSPVSPALERSPAPSPAHHSDKSGVIRQALRKQADFDKS